MTITAGKFTFDAELDYDWQHADSTFASGTLEIDGGDGAEDAPEIIELLQDRDVSYALGNVYGNKYVCLLVFKINGVQVRECGQDGMSVSYAVREYLREHPDARFFELDGRMG